LDELGSNQSSLNNKSDTGGDSEASTKKVAQMRITVMASKTELIRIARCIVSSPFFDSY
jgi:hypothetical protein